MDETLSFSLGQSTDFGSHVDVIIGFGWHAAVVVDGPCSRRSDLIEHPRLWGLSTYSHPAVCSIASVCSMASATVMDLFDGDSSEYFTHVIAVAGYRERGGSVARTRCRQVSPM